MRGSRGGELRPAVADLQSRLKAAEKRATDAEKQLKGLQASREGGGVAAMPDKELDPTAPGGKNDPVMPGGKLEADRPGKKEMEKKNMEKPGGNKDAPAATVPLYEFIKGDEKRWSVAEKLEGYQRSEKAVGRVWPVISR